MASRVAGFQTWRKLGRHVVKGAKGIAILAPCIYGKKAEPEEDDSPTNKRLGGFKVVWVFAEEDTDGEPLPILTMLPRRAERNYFLGGRVVIRKSLETPAKAAVILHELRHELLHRGENRKTLSKRQREAEATAYVVMRHFEIEHVASNYLAAYNVDGEQLRESLENHQQRCEALSRRDRRQSA